MKYVSPWGRAIVVPVLLLVLGLLLGATAKSDCDPIFKGPLTLVNPFQIAFDSMPDDKSGNSNFMMYVFKNGKPNGTPTIYAPTMELENLREATDEAKIAGKMLFLDGRAPTGHGLYFNVGQAGEN